VESTEGYQKRPKKVLKWTQLIKFQTNLHYMTAEETRNEPLKTSKSPLTKLNRTTNKTHAISFNTQPAQQLAPSIALSDDTVPQRTPQLRQPVRKTNACDLVQHSSSPAISTIHRLIRRRDPPKTPSTPPTSSETAQIVVGQSNNA